MKKKGILMGTILLVIIATIVTCFMISGRNTLESHLKLAVKYFNEGNYEEAILEFDKAIAIDDKIFSVYLAKANTEIIMESADDALESTVKMIDLLKVNDDIENDAMKKVYVILQDMYHTGKCLEKEDLLVWFYEKAYGNEKYQEYISWLDDYLSDKYHEALDKIRDAYETEMREKFLSNYDTILADYKKATENNFKYDYLNGEMFEDIYPNVNAELAMGGGLSDLHYSLTDLNGDNVPELIVGSIKNPTYDNINDDWCPDYSIWDIYGLENGNPKRIIDIYSVGYRRHYKLFENGILGCMSVGNGNENGMVISYYFYTVEKATEMPVYALQSDTTVAGGKYMMGTSSPNEEISKEKYDSIFNSYQSKTNIKWNPINDYSSEKGEENVSEVNATLTEEEAFPLVENKIKSEGAWQDGMVLILTGEDSERFTFGYGIDAPEKVTFMNYYDVNKKTKEVTSMF